ncbi:MAG TPA: diacylglycerol kinase family protein [Longimicrobiales bacterium]
MEHPIGSAPRSPAATRVILNPAARHGSGRRIRPLIERELERHAIAFDIHETEGPGHAADLARAAAEEGALRVIAAGGDGTAHEVANGLLAVSGRPPAFGLIPIGTGNDFVKMVPGSGTLPDALATLVSGSEVPVDVGVARWDGGVEYFLNAMGTGIDVEVVRQMRRSRWLPGAAIYVSALLRALVRYRPLPLRIGMDGEVFEQRIMNLAICNGPSIGGSFRICPEARFDDGLLDMCVIAAMPMHRNLRLVRRVIAGTHAGQRGVSMLKGRHFDLALTGRGPLHFQLDGELREAPGGSVDVEVAARRLHVICRIDDRTARRVS